MGGNIVVHRLPDGQKGLPWVFSWDIAGRVYGLAPSADGSRRLAGHVPRLTRRFDSGRSPAVMLPRPAPRAQPWTDGCAGRVHRQGCHAARLRAGNGVATRRPHRTVALCLPDRWWPIARRRCLLSQILSTIVPGTPIAIAVRRGAQPSASTFQTSRRDSPVLSLFLGTDREWVAWMPGRGITTPPIAGDHGGCWAGTSTRVWRRLPNSYPMSRYESSASPTAD